MNETVELLQVLIRNGCVNDGRPESGQEVRNADVLESYLDGSGFDMQRFEALPDRPSLVARIEGSDAKAPSFSCQRWSHLSADGFKNGPRRDFDCLWAVVRLLVSHRPTTHQSRERYLSQRLCWAPWPWKSSALWSFRRSSRH